MTSLLFAACAALGMYFMVTHSTPRQRSLNPGRKPLWRAANNRVQRLLLQAGLDGVSPVQFLGASVVVGILAMIPAAAIFGTGLSTLLIGGCAATTPATIWRKRRAKARAVARESWPRFIEELRVLTGSVGRSIPQALLEVGLRGPVELRSAFQAAQREWSLTTDFERTLHVLKDRLADPTADATFETLLVATQVGGDIDSRLAALAEDRREDLLGRKEADAKQAGARLARIFVILVPAGMALAGLSVGNGSAAYRTPIGQVLVSIGIALIILCWVWASRIMRLPEAQRVFDR
ncbi:MAG: type II secretion system F family protein [Actinomycetes bacterium]